MLCWPDLFLRLDFQQKISRPNSFKSLGSNAEWDPLEEHTKLHYVDF